jgi:hypothetical protein
MAGAMAGTELVTAMAQTGYLGRPQVVARSDAAA